MPQLAFTLTIPLPPKECSPNAKNSGNWRKKGAAVKAYRQTVRFLAQSERPTFADEPMFQRATITPTFYCHRSLTAVDRYYPLDSTNAAASLKPAVDGLVDARVLGADDHRHVRMMPPVLKRTKKEHLGRTEVVLLIEEWES